MIHTKINDLLNIEYPILQGGMAWVAEGNLAAAVSNGGGLGTIAGGSAPADIIEQEIKKTVNQTDKPFALNIMLMSPFADDLAQLAVDCRVPVVVTGAGNPGKYIPMWKEAGIKVIPVVASAALAIRLERAGADALVAEGLEAGGHIGEMTTMSLVPQIVDSVSVPVVAAGGIADGRGVAAAFMLGAQGVQVGTRFICAQECRAHQNYKELLIKAKDSDTVVTGRSGGHPVRSLKNRLTKKFDQIEKAGATFEELEELTVGSLSKAVLSGDLEQGSFMAGQSAGLVKKIQPAGEIIAEMFEEASATIRRISADWNK